MSTPQPQDGCYSTTSSASFSSHPHFPQSHPSGNPQTAHTIDSSSNHCHVPASPSKKSGSRRDLPPLFWYMEMGDWEKATARAKSHPKEVKIRATMRTKSMAVDGTKVSGTKRLALHHACFKLRSAGSAAFPVPSSTPKIRNSSSTGEPISHISKHSREEDPFLSVCKFILLLLEIYPEACQVRESRHGCLPLHLAAFASCCVRNSSTDDNNDDTTVSYAKSSSSGITTSCYTYHSHGPPPGPPIRSSSAPTSGPSAIVKPGIVTSRSTSESTTSTVHSNMTAVLMEESFAGAQTMRKKEGEQAPTPMTPRSVSLQQQQALPPSEQQQQRAPETTQQTLFISNKREQMAVKVLNAMLDAHPRAIRLDSEGGRLPLHTACAGRATPRCVSLLLRAYPAAARHRNKDGFLPLHLAAHWGVSHPNVAITLLKAYPDATVGRNRWERTPLEEALVMAGENGRPHQAPLVRALRKHPSYWTQPPKELFKAMDHQGTGGVGSNLVDIDVTLASNDDSTSQDDNPRYFNAGHTLLLDDEYENIPEGEETEIGYVHSQGGIISRFTRRRSSNNVDMNQDLPTLIKNLKWKSVIAYLEYNPNEANEHLVGVMTRGGFQASANMTPLHYACERKPPVEAVLALMEANPEAVTQRMMPGGCLPLHVAATWGASPAVIGALLSADPQTAKVVDELGNRPLHSACFAGAAVPIIYDLLSTYPKAVLSRNNQGSQPIDICRRLKHPNRRAVMTALLEKKDYIIAKQKHRRTKSSGSTGDSSETPGTMDDQYGIPSLSDLTSFDYKVAATRTSKNDDECLPAVGVEVTYQDQEKSHTLLWI